MFVNYQSFSRHLADGAGCTTFSFGVNLGIRFRAVPPERSATKGPEPTVQPHMSDCHFRLSLAKKIGQMVLPRPDIWYVEPDGSNLRECLEDSRSAIENGGLAWFSRFESLEVVLALLMEQEQLPEVFATRASAARKRMIGYIARRLGRTALSEPLIAEAESEIRAIKEKVGTLGCGKSDCRPPGSMR